MNPCFMTHEESKEQDFQLESGMKRCSDVSFNWTDLTCSVYHRVKKCDVQILKGVSGAASSGELVAIVGASGGGKSTLLDILAGRKTVGTITGDVMVKGEPASKNFLNAVSSYVTQESLFHPTQTVMEAAMFQAQLRLDPSLPYSNKIEIYKELIGMAGLTGRDNEYIGGTLPGGLMLRGLSGGEKRRLSVCCATITNPEILFADEPTTGLDSLAALMIMKFLRQLCGRGMLVLSTIHQPRQAIWSLFDKVLVLVKGHQLFYGRPADVEPWFAHKLGLHCPVGVSIAEYVIDVSNTDFTQKLAILAGTTDSSNASTWKAPVAGGENAEFRCEKDLENAAKLFHDLHPYVGEAGVGTEGLCGVTTEADEEVSEREVPRVCVVSDNTPALDPPMRAKPGWWMQYKVLLQRNFLSYMRNWVNVFARLVVCTVAAITSGLVYFNLGASTKPSVTQNIFGAVFFNILALCLLPIASQAVWLYDRQFFQAEHAAGMYTCSAFFAASLTLELLFNSVNGILYGTITYHLINYQAFVHAVNPLASALGFIGIVTIMNLIGNAQVLFMTLVSPNQEVAFVIAAGYLTIATLTAGAYVTYPDLYPPLNFTQYLSMMKYPYQAALLHFFQDNANAVGYMGVPVSFYLEQNLFNTPPTVWANVVISVAWYVGFLLVGYICLRHLYGEKR